MFWEYGQFFQLLTGTSERKAVSTVAKNALKSVKVSRFVSDWRHTAPQSRRILQMVRDKFVLTCHNANAFNISRICGAIPSFSFDISPLNLVIKLPYF